MRWCGRGGEEELSWIWSRGQNVGRKWGWGWGGGVGRMSGRGGIVFWVGLGTRCFDVGEHRVPAKWRISPGLAGFPLPF